MGAPQRAGAARTTMNPLGTCEDSKRAEYMRSRIKLGLLRETYPILLVLRSILQAAVDS